MASQDIPVQRGAPEIVVHGPNGKNDIISLAQNASVTVGRSPSNTLSFPDDQGLSRQHFVIERVGNTVVVRDLGSKNGTELNAGRITGPTVLKAGDRVKAGRLSIEFRHGVPKPPTHTVLFVDAAASGPAGGTVIATNLQAALSKQSSPGMSASAAINALIRAGQELAAHRPLEELFPLILDLSIEAVGASRGVLITTGPDGAVPQAARGENFKISAAVKDRVLNEKSSLLVVDALLDSDFAARNSIVMQGVRSIVAAPLQTGDEVIGLLYLDLTNPTRTFTSDDLNLLTVMANIAAIRIRHARLIEIEAQDRIHQRELAQAAEIQRGLLPLAPPDFDGLALAGYNLPCLGVGGDYFDYLPYGGGKLALVVGDVAGKGMSAALLMASLQAHAQALTEQGGDDVAALVAKLNRAVQSRSPGDRFVTFFLGVFDPEISAITYCNAGHNAPLVMRATGEVDRLKGGGMVLGIYPGAPYQNTTVPFREGDLLVLYSDGVVEASAAGRDEDFGDVRLARVVRENGSKELPAIIDKVIDELRAWTGENSFADDVTLVLARRTAHQRRKERGLE